MLLVIYSILTPDGSLLLIYPAPGISCLVTHDCLVTRDCAASECGLNAADVVPTALSIVQGGVVAGLGCARAMFNAVGAASNLMQDFRTGYLTLASAKVCLSVSFVRPTPFIVVQPIRFAYAHHALRT